MSALFPAPLREFSRSIFGLKRFDPAIKTTNLILFRESGGEEISLYTKLYSINYNDSQLKK